MNQPVCVIFAFRGVKVVLCCQGALKVRAMCDGPKPALREALTVMSIFVPSVLCSVLS